MHLYSHDVMVRIENVTKCMCLFMSKANTIQPEYKPNLACSENGVSGLPAVVIMIHVSINSYTCMRTFPTA